MRHRFALLAGLLALTIVGACSHRYTPPQVPNADDLRVYGELADAGCMAPGDDGAAATALDQAHARVDQPAWVACLYQEGGTVAACGCGQ